MLLQTIYSEYTSALLQVLVARNLPTPGDETPNPDANDPTIDALEASFRRLMVEPDDVFASQHFQQNFSVIVMALFVSNLPCSAAKYEKL